jgi:DNA-binding NtrC family response regulator
VISATNRRLIDQVAAKEFRDDLYNRLNVIHIHVPPLRDRRDDIPVLVDHFLRSFGGCHLIDQPAIEPDALARLVDWHWPGNIRELRNVVERLVLCCRNGVIVRADLPREFVCEPSLRPAAVAVPMPTRAELLFEQIVVKRESFWSAVGEPFLARDLTRDDVRAVVRRGLQTTNGSYKTLVQLFNMPGDDYKKFLGFLRKYRSHMPIQEFRTVRATLAQPAPTRRAVPD